MKQMKISVIAGLIVAVHVMVAVVVVAPGCMAQRGGNEPGMSNEVLPPDVPVMPPTVEAEPVVAEPVVVPPVVEPVDVPVAAPAVDNVYVIQSGDSLSKIAARHGVKTAELAELNNIADANKIRVGQKIVLPAYAKASTSAPKAPAAAQKPAAPAKAEVAADGIYVVKNGDALSKIAKAHGVKQSEIMELNGIKDANKIRIGQKLKMPVAGAAAAAPKAEKKAAEKKAEKPVEEIVPAAAPVAETVLAPAPAAEAPAPAAAPSFDADLLPYTVNAGDTVESVANLFGVSAAAIRSQNGLAADAQLQPGQSIVIPPIQ